MRRLIATAVAAVATVLLASACARPATEPAASSTAAASPTAAASDETTAILVEVLRRYLSSTSENSNLGGEVIYILDHTDPAAADPMSGGNQGSSAFSTATRAAFTEALKDKAPVRFVATREEAYTNQDSCTVVRDNGILMVLGPPKRSGSVYHVGVHGFVACLGATWLTYVVEHSGAGWTVTGTTGPMAVA
jgi:hypothetical protein